MLITNPPRKKAESEKADGKVDSSELMAEFELNFKYDRFALVDYTVEDIEAHFGATVSAREDGAQYELHHNMDGEEQALVLDGDFNIISNLTGNMTYDAPIVIQKAIDTDEWAQSDK